MNILIAEDDPIILKRLQHFLEKWTHRVIPAQNGLDALEKFLSEEVDLLISDWIMPKMDGLELISHIRNQVAGKPFVYIILLTAKGDKTDVVTALTEGGVDDYMIKPFDPEELRARVGVGERMVRLERKLREYSHGLEQIVRRQTREIRHSHEETIIRLLTALESRDEETGGHVRRIALFSATLAEAAKWSPDRVDDLRIAAPMHDIGKIGVPDGILLKRGPLTGTEYEKIKAHSIIGGEILKDSEYPILQMAYDIALNHHERWDGKGYPQGLKGVDIPEAARIVALVDVYDALIHDRIYRRASSEKEALDIMAEGRGTQFDPHLYDLFIKSLSAFRQINLKNP